MKTPEISLIIPVYNCAKVLPNSLKCVQKQSFKDFEVILVNDGSTDLSGMYCDEMAQKDCRFRAIHKNNGGPSSARNIGLANSSGRWIVFMDADDEIGNDYLEQLHNNRCSNGVAVAGFYENKNGKVSISVDFGHNDYSVSKGNFYDISKNKLLYGHPSPIAKIFDGALIRKNKIHFNTNISLCEDLIFWMEYICKAENIKLIAPIQYYYLKDNSFLTKKKHSFDSYYELYCEFCRLSYDFAKINRNEISDECMTHLAIFAMNATISLYNEPLARTNRIKKLRQIRQESFKFIQKSYIPHTIFLRFKKWLFLYNIVFFDLINLIKSNH